MDDQKDKQAVPGGSQPKDHNPDSVAQYYENYFGYPGQRRAPGGPNYRPEKKGGWPRWATWLILCIVLFGGGCTALVLYGIRQLKQSGFIPNIPPAAVLAGTPLAWRELASLPRHDRSSFVISSFEAYMVIADFNGDGDDEIVYEDDPGDQYNSIGSLRLMELDGTITQLVMPYTTSYYTLAAWDCNGDGTSDIAIDDFNQSVSFHDLQGNSIKQLSGVLPRYFDPLADVNGDGVLDILLEDPSSYAQFNAYDTQGNMVWSVAGSSSPGGLTAGDVDGDGKDEVIEDNWSYLTISGEGQSPATHGNWQGTGKAHSGFDLTGDGTDEIICAEYGYLDPVTTKFVNFQLPSNLGSMSSFWENQVVQFDINADSSADLVICLRSIAYQGRPQCTAIYGFDQQGALVYREEFGENIHEIGVAQAGGVDHLLVMTDSRMLIYP